MQSTAEGSCHAATTLSADVLSVIESAWRSSGKSRNEFCVLDWGCGSGYYVEHLRRLGYRAFGVDISQVALARAEDRLKAAGLWEPGAFQLLVEGNRTAFPAASVDCVFSFQVLEHVEDLETVVHEIRRVTAPSGCGLHIFPARWRPLEVHLRMPLVHWLPKNGLRKAAILLCLVMGARPRWGEPLPRSLSGQAQVFYRYSCSNTYYRPLRSVVGAFAAAGLRPRYAVLDNPSAARASRIIPRVVLEWLVVNFWSVRLKLLSSEAGIEVAGRDGQQASGVSS